MMSRKGKRIISIGGYTFCMRYVAGLKKRWLCSTHYTKKCRAVIQTYEDEIISINNIHNHLIHFIFIQKYPQLLNTAYH